MPEGTRKSTRLAEKRIQTEGKSKPKQTRMEKRSNSNFESYQKCYNEWLLSQKQKFDHKIQNPRAIQISLDRFEHVGTVAKGTFGRVDLVRNKTTMEYQAIKCIKVYRGEKPTEKYVEREKEILAAVEFPFIVSFKYYLRNHVEHFLVLEFVQGGDLYSLLQKRKKLMVDHAKFYTAQLVLALEYLHAMQILFGDLKPENVLIGLDGYIKLADFGHAVLWKGTPLQRTRGTYGYNAPEILRCEKYDFSIDWFSLGAVLFELCRGKTPFFAESEEKMQAKTLAGKFVYPYFFPGDLKSVIGGLLEANPRKRLGNSDNGNGAGDVKSHAFFRSINFDSLFHKRILAPYVPKVQGPTDTSHFKQD